uniref:Uncharacterized protein n=1 Tax=Romanomermis culicivorax TaxID=13658 RepID=A0A915JES2_ROMCU
MQKTSGVHPPPRRTDPYYVDDCNYVWLCGQMDLKSACRLIAVFEFLATILAFVLLIVFYCVFYSETYAYQLICSSWSLGVGIFCCICSIGILFLFFGGIKNENSGVLLIHIGMQIFSLIAMIFAAIVAIVLIIGWSEVEFGPEVILNPTRQGRVQDEYAADKTGCLIGVIVLILCAIGSSFETWFLMIILKTYRLFLKQEKMAYSGGGQRQMTTNQMTDSVKLGVKSSLKRSNSHDNSTGKRSLVFEDGIKKIVNETVKNDDGEKSPTSQTFPQDKKQKEKQKQKKVMKEAQQQENGKNDQEQQNQQTEKQGPQSSSLSASRKGTLARKHTLWQLYEDDKENHFSSIGHYLKSFKGSSTEQMDGEKKVKTQEQKLGTILGVYLPSIQNVLGIQMFLRLLWIVGMSGVVESFSMVAICCLCVRALLCSNVSRSITSDEC